MSKMPTDNTQPANPTKRRNVRLALRIGIPLLLLAGIYLLFRGPESSEGGSLTFKVRKGPLDIKVLELGNIEALESQRIKSGIKGETKILQIVEEGHFVTEEEVKNGKILVTLDNSKIIENLTQQEIQYQGAEAGYTEAKEQYAITIKENESAIKSAELAVKFARMDLEKYIGEKSAKRLVPFLDEQVASAPEPALRPAPAPDPFLGQNTPNAEGGERGRYFQGGEGGPDGQQGGDRPRRRRRPEGEAGAPGQGGAGGEMGGGSSDRSRGGQGGGGFNRPSGDQGGGGGDRPSGGSGGGGGGGPRGASSKSESAPLSVQNLDAILAAEPVSSEIVKEALDKSKEKVEAPATSAIPETKEAVTAIAKDPAEKQDSAEGAKDAGKKEAPADAPKDETKDPKAGDKIKLQSDVKIQAPVKDILDFVNMKELEGDSEQKRRELESKKVVSEQEDLLSKNRLEWTKKLREKNFVTQSELDSDAMKVLQSEIGRESAKTAEDLFIKYEFPKEVQKLSSDYQEALRKLDVTGRQAVSKLAQAEARLRSEQATYDLQRRRRDELREQLLKCEIKAERVGLVVYAGSERQFRNQNQQIEEGATVYEQQEILTIPDMTQMAVTVKVHESVVKQVQRGQKVKIRLESYSEELLNGEVTKVSVLPDSSSRYFNPELKVYPTTVTIDGTYDWLKPGMTARVEILVKQLPNVFYVPIQAVQQSGSQRVVYVAKATGYEMRPVETGEFNQDFIEIKSGVEEGDSVLLRAPEAERLKEEKEFSGQEDTKVDQNGQNGSPQNAPAAVAPATPGPDPASVAGPGGQDGGGQGGRSRQRGGQ
jgi:RND family efflux transporter MFP subunit